MDIHKYIKKLIKVNHFGLLIVGFVLGLVAMYLYFQPKLVYQGETASAWANIADQNKKEADTYKIQLASASAEITTLLVTTTKTPPPTSNPYAKMPSWCRDDIAANNAAYQPLGYSQGAINEIIKKQNPECATY
jgi:hypothetical protein